jgi:hypothetical protein
MAGHIAQTSKLNVVAKLLKPFQTEPVPLDVAIMGNRIHSGLFSLSLSKRRRTPPHASPHASWILRRCHLIAALHREEPDNRRKDLNSFDTTMEKRDV